MSIESKFDYLKEILKASHIYDLAVETRLHQASILSKQFNNNIYFKREDEQVGYSSKIRGIYNMLKKISQKHKNLVCASTTNYVYALALVASKFGCQVTSIMPTTTSSSKVCLIEKVGATIILKGDNYHQSIQHARSYAVENDCYFVESSENEEMIAGNATIGVEIVKQFASQMSKLNAIVVPIDQGSLISGLAIYIKELYPNVKIIGVEIENVCPMKTSIKEGKLIESKKVNTFVDCIGIIGPKAYELCQKYVDEIILVTVDEVCASIKQIYEETKNIVELVCAMSLAGLTKYIDQRHLLNENLIAILTGGNLDFDKLQFIAQRARIGDKSEAVIKISIPECSGSLLKLLNYIDNDCTSDSINISQFHYKYNTHHQASILIGFSMGSDIGTESLIELIQQNYPVVKLNTLQSHSISSYIPFIIGGLNYQHADEHIFTFVLPERKGALRELLESFKDEVGITMFHYQNTGDIYANVLMGLRLLTINYQRLIEIFNQLTQISYADATHTYFATIDSSGTQ